MKTVKYMDEDIAIKKGVEALIKELGPVEAIRFVTMPKRKRLDSVKRQENGRKF